MGILKRPKPADPAEEPGDADVEIPPKEHKTVVQRADPIEMPSTPEQVIHNVMVRQLEDDAVNPPEETDDVPALKLLAELQRRKDRGESVMPLADDIGRITQGVDVETKITFLAYISVQNRNLTGWMKSGESLNRLLWRMCHRGDLKPHEAIVLKRLQVQEQQVIVDTVQKMVEQGNLHLNENAAATMDYTVTVTDKTKVHKNLEKMSPQGREIFRKIVVRARRKTFQKKAEAQ